MSKRSRTRSPRAALPDWAGSFEQSLARAMLVSERRRMAVMAGFFGVCLVASLLYVVVPVGMTTPFRVGFLKAMPIWVTFYAAIVAYELGLRELVGWYLWHGKSFPRGVRFLNAAVEISLPTFALVSAMRFYPPGEALFTAPLLFYLIVVLLTTLKLDPPLCAFAGCLAAAEYLAVVYWRVQPAADGGAMGVLNDPSQHAARAGVFALGGLAAAFVAGQVRRRFEESLRAMEERNRAVSIFGRHVSPQVARKLLDQVGEPEMREVCVMFLDIRDFTRFARERSPQEVMDYLNTLFGPMIDIVNQSHGIVNKFLGDGFMAVFGAPIDDGESRRHAIEAAREIIRWVEILNKSGRAPPTRVGIGLHAGTVVTGEVGSADRGEYTVIGDVVNLASRVEQLNKQFGSQVLLTEVVREALNGDEGIESVGPVAVKGLEKPVAIYRMA